MSGSPSHSPTPTPSTTVRQSTPRPTTPTRATTGPSSSTARATSPSFSRPRPVAGRNEAPQQQTQSILPSIAVPSIALPESSTRPRPSFPHTPSIPSTSSFTDMRRPSSRGPSSSPEFLLQQRQPPTNKRRMDHSPSGHRVNRPRASSGSSLSHTGSAADTEGHHDGDSTGPSVQPSVKKKRTRTLTTPYQSQMLHALLAQSRFPTTSQREEVGRAIGLSSRKVQIWFQNQRQKARRPPRTLPAQTATSSQPSQPPSPPLADSFGRSSGSTDHRQTVMYPPPPPPGSYSASFWERESYSRQSYVAQYSPPPPSSYSHSRMAMPPPSPQLSAPVSRTRGEGRGEYQSPYPYEDDHHSPRYDFESPSGRRYSSPPPSRSHQYYRDPTRTLPPIIFGGERERMTASDDYYSTHRERERYQPYSSTRPERYDSLSSPARRARSPAPSHSGVSHGDVPADEEPAILRGERYDPVRGVYVPIRRHDDHPSSNPSS